MQGACSPRSSSRLPASSSSRCASPSPGRRCRECPASCSTRSPASTSRSTRRRRSTSPCWSSSGCSMPATCLAQRWGCCMAGSPSSGCRCSRPTSIISSTSRPASCSASPASGCGPTRVRARWRRWRPPSIASAGGWRGVMQRAPSCWRRSASGSPAPPSGCCGRRCRWHSSPQSMPCSAPAAFSRGRTAA